MGKKNNKNMPKQGELVKLTNGMINGFMNNPSVNKLRQLKGLRAETRYKLFVLVSKIYNSPEAEALEASKKVIVEEYEKNQMKLEKENRKPLTIDHPKVRELFALDSGLEINKLIISNSQIPSDFTEIDMDATKWIIQWEE